MFGPHQTKRLLSVAGMMRAESRLLQTANNKRRDLLIVFDDKNSNNLRSVAQGP
jgi:hypothetical protein